MESQKITDKFRSFYPIFNRPNMDTEVFTAYAFTDESISLLFEESQRPDVAYAHRGRLHVPTSSPFMHFVSLTKGAMRMVMVSQLDQVGRMHGLITTVAKSGAMMLPVSAPIVYLRKDTVPDATCGEIAPDHDLHGEYSACLSHSVENGYVLLLGAKP